MPEYVVNPPVCVTIEAPTALEAWREAISRAEQCPGHFIPEHEKSYSPARVSETLASRNARRAKEKGE